MKNNSELNASMGLPHSRKDELIQAVSQSKFFNHLVARRDTSSRAASELCAMEEAIDSVFSARTLEKERSAIKTLKFIAPMAGNAVCDFAMTHTSRKHQAEAMTLLHRFAGVNYINPRHGMSDGSCSVSETAKDLRARIIDFKNVAIDVSERDQRRLAHYMGAVQRRLLRVVSAS